MVHVHTVVPATTQASTPRQRSSARYTRLPAPSFRQHVERQTRAVEVAPVQTKPARVTVERGDTLWGIVKEQLQSSGVKHSQQQVADMVQQVARNNGMANPNLIRPGQQIDLSGLPQGKGLAQATAVSQPVQVPDVVQKAVPVRKGTKYVRLRPAAEGAGGPDMKHKVRLFDVFRRNKKAKAEVAAVAAAPVTAAPVEVKPAYTRPLNGVGRLSSNYGTRKDPFTGKMRFHNGIDVAARTGTPIYPYRSGTVTFSGTKGGYGNVVMVRHEDGMESVYAHASKNLVKVGEAVTPDTAIGLVGSTGRSTGPHLHFELRKSGKAVNPMPYLEHDHGAHVHLAQS